jgi:hypothetical protein
VPKVTRPMNVFSLMVDLSKDMIEKSKSCLTPQNLSRFVETGEAQQLRGPATEVNGKVNLNMIYVKGCGRSGTTMLFNYIHKYLKLNQSNQVIALDEPRLLYMQGL